MPINHRPEKSHFLFIETPVNGNVPNPIKANNPIIDRIITGFIFACLRFKEPTSINDTLILKNWAAFLNPVTENPILLNPLRQTFGFYTHDRDQRFRFWFASNVEITIALNYNENAAS